MTKIATNINRMLATRNQNPIDQKWFYYTILGVAPGGLGVFTSEILQQNTVISKIHVELKAPDPTDDISDFDITFCLVDRENPPVAEITRADRIIKFDVGENSVWTPVFHPCSIFYPCRKTVIGAQKRIAIQIRNASLITLDVRCGVLYTV